jgi:parvulin-like peptidyl-prolyl isomerase
MKRFLTCVLALSLSMAAMTAQTTIDKPAATVKLTRLEIISVRQFRSNVEKIETALGQKLTAEQRQQLLEKMIDEMLFAQYCDREKIIVSDSDINTALTQMKSSLGPGADDTKLEIALRSQGIYLDARSYARQQLLLKAYLQAKKADELKAVKEPTSEEILQAYELYKSQLVRPDTVRVSVIYVDFRSLSADDKKKASDALRQAASTIKASPARFDEYVLRAADAGSLLKANSNFYVEKTPQAISVYGSTFVDAVFGMKVGDISAVIENEAGLQVVRVNEVLPQKMLTLTDPLPNNPNATVQDYIKYVLATKKQQDILGKIQTELHDLLRKSSDVKIFTENLAF